MVLGHKNIRNTTPHQAGRELLRQMYTAYRHRPMPEILTAHGGKPYFAGDCLQFSITHTKNHVFCALSEFPVGIDAEELDRRVNLGLADKILSDSERQRYEKAPDKRLALLRFWVLKEAYVKLLGTGLTGYPNGTDFDPEDGRIQIRQGCLLAVMEHREESFPVEID